MGCHQSDSSSESNKTGIATSPIKRVPLQEGGKTTRYENADASSTFSMRDAAFDNNTIVDFMAHLDKYNNNEFKLKATAAGFSAAEMELNL